MPDPYLPRRLQGRGYRSSRFALPVGTPSTALEANPDDGGGLFGLGIGPDVNLGIGTAFRELGQGVTSLAALLTPGSKEGEPGFQQLNAGLTSSLAGTALTLAKPLTAPIKALGGPDIESALERSVGRALGEGEEEEEAFKAHDFWEAAQDRGLLPSLVENVGNVALAGAAVTAPSKAASVAARFGGAAETSARFAAINAGLKSRPLIHAMQHPYRTAGKALRTEVLAPAASKVEAASGLLPQGSSAPVDFLAAELPDNNVDYSRVRVDMDRHARTAEAYKNLPDNDPRAHAAYDAFRTEVREQYRHLTEDLGVTVEAVDTDPYATAADMVADVRDNKRLQVLKTGDGEHPFLTPEENDMFRAVHDAYGHAATGQAFGRHGEEAAFIAHRGMFGDEAGKAMATETRGQNSVLIADGEFGKQKVALLPDDLADPAAAVAAFQKANPMAPPGAVTKFLAGIEQKLVGRDVHRKALEETRLAEMERRTAARSPAVRTAVAVARDHLMEAGKAQGITLSRKEASLIVGDELRARMTGIKALEEEYLGRGVPEDVFISTGIRERFVPKELRTPEMETALAAAVDAQLQASAETRATLMETSGKGLEDPEALDPALTKAQQKLVKQAAAKLERAHSDVLARKTAREVASREKYIAAETDKLGRIAAATRRVDELAGEAVADFEHSRVWTPKAWRGAGAMERSAASIYEQTIADVAAHDGEWGGASFNPHTGRFIKGGEDAGFAVGLIPGTALTVPFDEFSPAHIEQVIRAYQDTYQHPNTVVGTWVEDGLVYIDPSEIVPTLDDAIIRGAARQQLSTFDVAGDTVVPGILKDRPDVAAPFISRHRNLSARTKELRSIAQRSGLTDADVATTMDLLMRQAVRAQDLGLVKHPDEFFSKHVSKFEFAKKRSSKAGALGQIVLERSAGTPAERAALWKEIEASVADLDKVRAWYDESHRLVEDLFRAQPDVTLLDGSKVNPADLMYQIVAITSFQAMPRDNWTRAMTAFQRFDELPRNEFKQLAAAMKKVTSGKATLEQAFGLGEGTKLADKFAGFALYPEPRMYLAELFSGRQIDSWTSDYLGEAAAAWGRKDKNLDRQRALDFIDAEHPGLIERIGEDSAIKEFYGRSHRAKIITFWDNLQNPDTSLGVTMDQQMERLFGVEMPLKQTATGTVDDAWIRYSEQVRDMAAELSETLGEHVAPHQLQAAMWVFAKEEVSRLTTGHFNALAGDASDMVRDLIPITDEADPILQWIEEASEPYIAEGQRHERQHRILRDETNPPAAAPPIGHTVSPIDHGTGQPVLRMEVRDPNAGPSRDLNYAADQGLVGFIDYTPGLRSPDEVYIHFMGVRPEARGQGISRALIEQLYELTGEQKVDFGDIEAPEVEVLRRKMAEAHPEKGNYGKPARGIPEEADKHLSRRKGEKVETVVYRPGWGASPREKKVLLFGRRKDRWLTARDEVNVAIAAGDVSTATKALNKFVAEVNGTGPLGLTDKASGADFLDIWMKGEFHTPAYLEAARNLERLDVPPGEMPSLLQSFKDKVLGEFVPLDDGTRGVIRIFEDGNLATLVHENGHLLRRILPEAEMRAVEGAYGIKGRKWEVAHEESFANDFLNYMQTAKAPAGLGSTFARVKEALADIWHMVSGSFQRRRVHPELATVFTSWLDPAVRPMDEGIPGLTALPGETGTLQQRVVRPPKLQSGAKTGDYYASGRKGQKALARLEQLAARKRSLAASQAATQARIDAVRTVLADNKLPSQLERDALIADASRLSEKLETQLGTPSISRTPPQWQPLWDAVLRLGKEADTNPEMGVIFDDLPATLHEIQNLALSAGFNPAHVREFSSVQVRRLVFGNMRLGLGRKDLLHEVEAGTRKKRTGTLSRAGAVDRSVESFLAATIEATNEKRTNAVVNWVEQHTARVIPAGSPIPAGWQLWDPVRTYLLTGTEMSADGLRAVDTSAKQSQIIPETVVRTLDRFSKDYDHWAWRSIRKVTSPWRTLVLTLSPGWYTRNVVGNIILASAEGTGLKDWQAAWHSYKSKDEIGHFADLPFVTSDTLAQEALASVDDSLIPRRGIGEAVAEGGKVRGTAQFASRKMLRVNEVVDEFARAAVYHRGVRANLTPEQAWHRAKEALVDYNALSPFERTAVRSVIPFYAWQKGILKVTLNQAIDHPARTAALTLLGRMQDEYIADRFGVDPEDVPDYYKHLSGGRNLRSFNPFSDPSEIVTVEGITRSMNPFIELAVRKGLGAPEFYTDQQRLGMFGSVQQDVDVPSALAEMVTRSPGGRILGNPDPAGAFGLGPVDDAALRSRFLRARRQIRDIPNPETLAATGTEGGSYLPPRLR